MKFAIERASHRRLGLKPNPIEKVEDVEKIIIRDRRGIPHVYWLKEIESLEALNAFAREHGTLLLTSIVPQDHYPCLEIYDDAIEG